jgi:hypothetical protein
MALKVFAASDKLLKNEASAPPGLQGLSLVSQNVNVTVQSALDFEYFANREDELDSMHQIVKRFPRSDITPVERHRKKSGTK